MDPVTPSPLQAPPRRRESRRPPTRAGLTVVVFWLAVLLLVGARVALFRGVGAPGADGSVSVGTVGPG